MKVVIDKCLLFFLLFVLGALFDFSDGFIVASMVAIIVNSLNYVKNDKRSTIILGGIYLCICVINPVSTIFIPLLFYDFFYQDCSYMCLFGIIGFYYYTEAYNLIYSVLLVGIMFICILLSTRTKNLIYMEKEFKRLRDDSTERALLLQSQNKALLESQEYEIHYAKLKERNRIAREIHDNVGHMLSRSILQVGAIVALNKDSELNGQLENLKKTLSEAMTSIRNSVHNLHDEAIDLESTINELIAGMTQYVIEFTYSMPKNINSGVKYCFITTVKEAMSNVVKHSNATKVIIYMVETDSHYQLNIKDNGTVEKEKSGVCSPGMGLENMRERAESLGGVFRTNHIEGFQIYLSIPKGKTDWR